MKIFILLMLLIGRTEAESPMKIPESTQNSGLGKWGRLNHLETELIRLYTRVAKLEAELAQLKSQMVGQSKAHEKKEKEQ